MKLSALFFVMLVISINISGCKRFTQKTNPEDTQIIKGVVDSDGEFKEIAKVGELPKKYLNGIGDEITFSAGKPFELVVSGFNPDDYDLTYSFDENTQTGSIKVEKKIEHPVVYLSKKCETINIPPGPIPEVIVDQSMPKEQVIITPRYSKDCYFLGYEIRFGATTRGCKDKDGNLGRLKKCRGRDEDLPYRSKNYWSKVLFGD